MQRYPMTVEGAEALHKELQNLKQVERPKIIKEIAEARAHGDLSENAEYHAAREQQGFIEARIKDVESRLSLAQIIDISKISNHGKVIFGAKVVLSKLDEDVTVTYQIVGEDEADINIGKISVNSPIARGIVGKEEGDVITAKTPGGDVEYEIVEVKY